MVKEKEKDRRKKRDRWIIETIFKSRPHWGM
jgi:hypothetical protein